MDFNTSVAPPSSSASDLRLPPFQGPLDVLAGLQEIRGRNQQSQAQGMENQQRQMDMQDQQAMRAMLPQLLTDPKNMRPDGTPDWNKVIPQIGPHVQPKTMFGLQQTVLGNQEKAANIQKAQADAVKAGADAQDTQTKIEQAERDYLGSVFLGIKNSNYSPAVADAALLHAEGISPQYKPHIDQLRALIAQDPSNLNAVVDQGIAASQAATTQAREQKTADATNAKTNQETSAARRSQAIQELSGIVDQQGNVLDQQALSRWQNTYKEIAPASTSPQALAQFQRSGVPVKEQPTFDMDVVKQKAMMALANQDPKTLDAQVDSIVPANDPMNASTKVLLRSAASRGDFQAIPKILQDAYDQRGRVQVAKESKQNAVTIDMGSLAGANGQPSETAKAVANYQVPYSTAVARLPGPAREALMAQVTAINPDYHQEYFSNFNKTESDATTGKIGTSANALNTMMGHLTVLKQASDALGSGDIQALNRIANFAGAQTGKDAVTTYNTIVHRLGPEVTKAYIAGGGSVGERGTNEADFDAALSPAQRNANIGVSAVLADSKIKALQDQYQRGTYGKGQQRLISDEAEAARQRLTGLAPASVRGGAGQSAPEITSKADYDKLAKGARYTQNGVEYVKK